MFYTTQTPVEMTLARGESLAVAARAFLADVPMTLADRPFLVRLLPGQRVRVVAAMDSDTVALAELYAGLDCDTVSAPQEIPTANGPITLWADDESLLQARPTVLCALALHPDYEDDTQPFVDGLLLTKTNHAGETLPLTAADLPALERFAYDGVTTVGRLTLPLLRIAGWSR